MIHPEIIDTGTPPSLVNSFTNIKLDDRRNSMTMRRIHIDDIVMRLDVISSSLDKVIEHQNKSLWEKFLSCFCIHASSKN